MKQPLLSGYTFTPSTGKIDFSNVPGFDPRRLFAVLDLASNVPIYIVGAQGLGGTFTGAVLALQTDVSDLDAGDTLFVLYEDGTAALPANAATADKQDTTNTKLDAIRALLAGSTIVADVPGTLTAGQSAVAVAANVTRQFIEITNTGPNPMAYRWGAAATATAGHILSPGQSVRYETKVPTAALNVFSTNGTTYFVTTG